MKNLKWKKNKRGYIAELGDVWYFIPNNASFWCSDLPNGNGQLHEDSFEERLKQGKAEAERHYESEC